MMPSLLLATTNEGKLREIRQALAGLGIEPLPLKALPSIPEPEENGASFSEIARQKADYYFRRSGMTALADDSGLEVEALGGAPGIFSSRFAATDPLRIERLLRELRQVDEAARAARFVCAICLTGPQGRVEVEGEVHGRIALQPSGAFGFGYDPVFFYAPLGKTFGEIRPEVKNRISHRAQALRRLREKLASKEESVWRPWHSIPRL